MTKKLLLAIALILPAFLYAQTTITLAPSKDAAIGYNTGFNVGDNNYGTAVHNSAFKIPSSDLTGYNENRGLIQFNLTSIPQGATIVSAKLNLYAYTTGSTVGHIQPDNAFYLKRVTQAWGENTVTWNNQPAATTSNQLLMPASTSPTQDYINIDVLTLVNDMIAFGNNGFMIQLAVEDTNRGVLFCSSNFPDQLKHPKLEITYLATPGCNTLNVLADASLGYHDGFNSGDDNYGNATNTSAFKIVSTDSSGFNGNRGLMKFDLSGVPPLATVTSATLDLHAYTTGATAGHIGTNNACYLQRVTGNWNENTVSWNNQPMAVSTNQVLLPASDSATQDYLNIDVSSLINDMLANGNNGFLLTMVDETAPNGLLFCSSNYSDSTKRPKLQLCWDYLCDAAFTYAIDTATSIVSFSSAQGGSHSWQINGNTYTTTNPAYQAIPGQTIIVSHTVSVPNVCTTTVVDTLTIPVPPFSPGCNFIAVAADAALGYHDGFNLGNDNYGNANNISAFKIISTDSSGFNGNRGLIKFDLSSLPALATITSARLNLHAYTTGPTGGHIGSANACYLQRVTSNWAENTVTWNNQPSAVSANQVLLPASDSATQDYLNIDVLSLVNDVRALGNNGFMLTMANETASHGLLFCSSDNADSSKRPTLEICWSFACDASFTATVDTATYIVNIVPTAGGVHTWDIDGTAFTTDAVQYQANPGDTIVINHHIDIPTLCSGDSSAIVILPYPSCNNGFSYNLVGPSALAAQSIQLVADMNYGTHNWTIDGVVLSETTPTVNVPVAYGSTINVEHYVSFGNYSCQQSALDTIMYPTPNHAFFQTHVTANGIPQNVTAFLLRLDYANNQILLERTFVTQPGTGWFLADSLADGDYILKAGITPSQYIIPTYHYSSVFWGDADVFTINGPGEYADKDINLVVSITNPGGTGFVGGYVDWADTLFARVDVTFEGTTVYLKDSNGNIVAYDNADENGYFQIDSLPLGQYTVYADLAGYEAAPVEVELTVDNPGTNEVEVLVGEATVGVTDKNVIKSVVLYPNPSNSNATLQVESAVTGAATINIVNMFGQVVHTKNLNLQEGTNRFTLSTATFANGIYHVTLATGSKYISTQKFVKY